MIQYDPKVVYEFADRMYSQARWIIVNYTITGALIGGIAGYLTGYFAGDETKTLFGLAGLAAAGSLGYAIGTEKAFSLKLQAQTALCQVKIEENTTKH